jgi:predicted outer membrane repeat protein
VHVLPSPGVTGRVALLLVGLSLPSPALAVTFRVSADGSGPFATIQEAIDAAADGDVVSVGPGTWGEVLTFGTKRITVRASDGAAATVLDGGGRVGIVTMAGDATLEGFTLHNAGGGGVTISGGSPTLSDLVFEDVGSAYLYGGAVYVSLGEPTFSGCTFTGGTAYQGAHLYVDGGRVTLLDSELSGGTATHGGSILLGQGTLVLDGVALHDNVASFHGGAVYTAGGTTLLATDTTFTDNVNSTGTTYGYGGGVFVGASATFAAERVTFTGNGSPDYATTIAYGGGLFLDSYSVTTLSSVTFDANVAYYGGGVFQNSYAQVDVTDSDLTANQSYYGGGFWISYGDQLSLTDTRVDANTSLYGGAGMYVYTVGRLSIVGSSFTDNLATYGYGAAVMAYYTGQLAVTESLFDGNVAYYAGGAFYLYDVDDVAFDTLTVTDNTATYADGGAVYATYSPAFSVTDSTFDGNQAYHSGGAIYQVGGLDVAGSQFTDNVADLRSGGALSVNGETLQSVRLVASTFTDNTAGGDGGAATVVDAGSLSVEGADLIDNTAGNAGGALYVEGAGRRTVRGNTIAGNRAEYGAGVYVSGAADPDAWTNNVLQENEARAGGGACFLETSATSLTNNVLVGNGASADGAALYLYDAVVDVRNVVVAYNTGAAAVFAWDAPAGLSFAYDDWYGNGGGDLAGAVDATVLDTTHQTGEPGFVAWSSNGDPTDDQFVLWGSSALVDAGDPALRDVDGSASDIGVYGGPHVSLEDADGDGAFAAWDCDDTNAEIAAGAADAWYDGVDQDCAGNSDYDQDHDGQDALAHGGEDCDDLDSLVTGACDTGDTAAVDDTDVVEPDPVEEVEAKGCGCASGGGVSGALVVGLGMLVGRRRVGRTHRSK